MGTREHDLRCQLGAPFVPDAGPTLRQCQRGPRTRGCQTLAAACILRCCISVAPLNIPRSVRPFRYNPLAPGAAGRAIQVSEVISTGACTVVCIPACSRARPGSAVAVADGGGTAPTCYLLAAASDTEHKHHQNLESLVYCLIQTDENGWGRAAASP